MQNLPNYIQIGPFKHAMDSWQFRLKTKFDLYNLDDVQAHVHHQAHGLVLVFVLTKAKEIVLLGLMLCMLWGTGAITHIPAPSEPTNYVYGELFVHLRWRWFKMNFKISLLLIH
jgi:hypothetical protein